jgi:hypothetical protein
MTRKQNMLKLFLVILNENNLIHFQKSIFEEVLMNSCFIFWFGKIKLEFKDNLEDIFIKN